MNNTMYSARELMVPGSTYDRSGLTNGGGGGPGGNPLGGYYRRDPYTRGAPPPPVPPPQRLPGPAGHPHDQLGFIQADRAGFPGGMSLPVPMGMFMAPVNAYPPQPQGMMRVIQL